MFKSMQEIRKQQRLKKNYYREIERNKLKEYIDPEDEGLVSFKNLYGNTDPTPAKADRKDYS